MADPRRTDAHTIQTSHLLISLELDDDEQPTVTDVVQVDVEPDAE